MINFPSNIFEKFSLHLKNTLSVAEWTAKEAGSANVGISHLLYAITCEKGSVGANVLDKYNFKPEKVKEVLALEKNEKSKVAVKDLSFDNAAKSVLKKAALLANKYNHKYIGTEHLLLGILEQKDSEAKSVFTKTELDVVKVKEHVNAIIENTSHFTDIAKTLDFSSITLPAKIEKYGDEREMPGDDEKGEKSALDYFCVDLNAEAENKKFDPIIGRDQEIEQMIIVLNRKIKNNPMLIGEPGVGKTAIVQGLAQRIVKGEVPESLAKKRIMSLDLGLLIAGSIYRGEFEGRLKDIIYELNQNKDIILFIDEFHTVIGTGSVTGSLDAANILKPALSRGELRCIAATTFAEFQKYVRKDAALERRFQPITVHEPGVEETTKIIKGLKPYFEDFHGVEITAEAVNQAVMLSKRFITDRFMPDKALDILDQTASYVKGKSGSKGNFLEIKKLLAKKNALLLDKEKAVRQENFERALKIKFEEEEVQKKINDLEKTVPSQKDRAKRKVGKEDVEKIVSQITRIPVSNIIEREAKRLGGLEDILKKEVVGQDEAISAMARVVRRSRAGIADPRRPLGSFLMLGPSGVGKTKLAEVLAQAVFGGDKNLIKINMSEFMERHNVSRLLGAPAGYVGYEEGGKLAETVRVKPYSVVLFDEVEKSHPDVANILLQILENGEIVDAQGRNVSFRNTIIIMTSNIGTQEFTREASLGFDSSRKEKGKEENVLDRYEKIKEKSLKDLKDRFAVELLNRIDEILVFKPLDKKVIQKITKLELGKLKKRLTEQKINATFTGELANHIAEKSFNTSYGARLIRKNIQNMVESLLAEKIIKGEMKEGQSVKVDFVEGKIKIS